MNKLSKLDWQPLALTLALSGALFRLTPHPVNVAPIGAMSLFAGARLRGWQRYAVPLIVIAVTDPIMGMLLGYPAFTLVTPFVCAGFLVYVWVGSRLRTTENPWIIGAAALLGATQFFLITNFGLWASGISYPATASGLVACYLAGIPYFGRTLLSDLLYAGILFGLHAWLSRRAFPAERVRKDSGVSPI